MKKYYLIAFLLFDFATLLPATAQNKVDKEKSKIELDPKYIELSKKASQYFGHAHYHFALPLYLQLEVLNPDDYEVNYRTGVCYLNTNSYNKAITILENTKKLKGKENHLDIGYYLARAYHLNHNFDKAIEYYNKYIINGNPNSEIDRAIAEDINIFIKQCQSGKVLSTHPVNIKIDHLSSKINSPYSEENPLITSDGNTMYFSSGRPANTGGKYDYETEQYFHDIYVSIKTGDHWSVAMPLKGAVNTAGNDAPVSISSDNKRLYMYTSINGDGDIFYSDKNDSTWSPLQDMGELINSPSFENSGSISANGQTFYFASDRDNGIGGYDLYKSELQSDGKWGIPVNMGPEINTEFDEADPFLLKDGKTLYFSSKGYNSMGGYDLFASKYDETLKAWTRPVNMGYPINSASDEVSISWTEDGKIGYYSEVNEQGMGKEDIYTLMLAEAPKVDKTPIARNTPPLPKKTNPTVDAYSSKPKLGETLKEQVHFALNESHTITTYSKNKADVIIVLLNKYPDLVIEIEGFAEDTDQEYTNTVSQNRIKAVYEYMIRKGINSSRLQTKVNKVDQNIPKNLTAGISDNEVKSRKVEFKIIGTNGSLSRK